MKQFFDLPTSNYPQRNEGGFSDVFFELFCETWLRGIDSTFLLDEANEITAIASNLSDHLPYIQIRGKVWHKMGSEFFSE